MTDHEEAIEYLTNHGFVATRRQWALGDTIVVGFSPLVGADVDRGEIRALEHVVWLIPATESSWQVVQRVQMHERRLAFVSLEDACDAAVALLRAQRITEPCQDCHGMRDVSFGERVVGAKLSWYIATSCRTCGAQTEADGPDSLPTDVRALEFARHGRWALVLRSGDPVNLMAALRRDLAIDMETTTRIRHALPGPILPGTIGEVLRVQNVLLKAGVEADVVPEAG